MALSFIGKPISLISHSDVRYRGILAGIDPAASTIQLSKVYSMGTETRRPPNDFIPPVQDPYEYIIFRASEVKDLSVDEPAMVRSVHDDPAVIGAGSAQPQPQPSQQAAYSSFVGGQVSASTYVQQQQQAQQRAQQPQVLPQQQPPRQQPSATPVTISAGAGAARNQPPRRGSNNVHTAAASLETVERALGDLRVSNNVHAIRGGGGRRGGNSHVAPKPIHVPNTDFDFQSSNAKFDKHAVGGAGAKSAGADGGDNGSDSDGETNPSEEGEENDKGKGKVKESTAYHPQKSFFDELTPGPVELRGGGGGGRGRRGGGPGARNRREEERERNVATFGEPGGVGLMGPGAYVGGWGGYGRRGGGRGGIRGGRGRGRGGPSVGVGA
ncbi:hypothetical protein E1B28_013724 [Marasmius oreades]|uniref:Uncharacterized protein n=1 Tax=Marasmius oreades TaxID=181124 RepID=A0A9P7UN28_9AGAR|nr:uncharacterized protein E1B28_013724 [Marasmius oreades]KAG7087783.1 hypothetical protein E1B28_013724 [Marasmius oreades]